MDEKNTRRAILWPSVGLISAGVAAFVGTLVAQQFGWGERLIADTGLVQGTSLLLLVAGAVSCAFLAWRHQANRLNLGLLAGLLTIFAGREADLHRPAFLVQHFTRWQFYVMPEVPAWQKLLFGCVIVGVLTTVILFVIRMIGPTLAAIKHKQDWALFALIWFCLLAGSQISDRSSLNDLFAGRAFEEVLETVAAGFALLVVRHFPRKLPLPSRPAAT